LGFVKHGRRGLGECSGAHSQFTFFDQEAFVLGLTMKVVATQAESYEGIQIVRQMIGNPRFERLVGLRVQGNAGNGEPGA
jgi:hypothetical protein